jgi:hypothetical protein
MPIGHLCYMQPLKNESPPDDKVLFVFYDFETTQDTRFSDTATQHVPILVCVQQFYSKCETVDVKEDCIRYGMRKHSFWEDPVGDLLSYLCEPRPWCNKVIAIAHNAKAFNLHFILNRAVILNWQPELITNGLKIVCMKVEHLTFIDSFSFMPLPLQSMSIHCSILSRSSNDAPFFFITDDKSRYVSVGFYPTRNFQPLVEFGEPGSRR